MARIERRSNLSYGWVLLGIVVAYILYKLLGSTWALWIAVAIAVVGIGFFVAQRQGEKKSSANKFFPSLLAIFGLVVLVTAGAFFIYDQIQNYKQKMHSTVKFDAPYPADTPFLPFKVGQKPMLNISFRNLGPSPLKDGDKLNVLVKIVSVEDTSAVFEKLSAGLPHSTPRGAVNAGERVSQTFGGEALTKQDVDGLKGGNRLLCALGTVEWSDISGNYETRLAKCGGFEEDGSFLWHAETGDNKVRLLE